jgi:hypothetical protein
MKKKKQPEISPLKPNEQWACGTRFTRWCEGTTEEYMLCLVSRYTFSLICTRTGNRWSDNKVVNPYGFEPGNSTTARFVKKMYPDFFRSLVDEKMFQVKVFIGDRRIS